MKRQITRTRLTPVPDIVLTTLNAKYAHAAFGLRYLMANLGELRDRAAILEFDISQRPVDVLEAILAQDPRSSASACTSGTRRSRSSSSPT